MPKFKKNHSPTETEDYKDFRFYKALLKEFIDQYKNQTVVTAELVQSYAQLIKAYQLFQLAQISLIGQIPKEKKSAKDHETLKKLGCYQIFGQLFITETSPVKSTPKRTSEFVSEQVRKINKHLKLALKASEIIQLVRLTETLQHDHLGELTTIINSHENGSEHLIEQIGSYQPPQDLASQRLVPTHIENEPLYQGITEYQRKKEPLIDAAKTQYGRIASATRSDPAFFRKLFIKFVESKRHAQRLPRYSTSETGDKRASNPEQAIISLQSLLQKDGVKLYQLALEEEVHSPEYRQAVFINSLTHLEDVTWSTRPTMVVGGPSGSGKSYATQVAMQTVSKVIGTPAPGTTSTYVSVDGGTARSTSQMRKYLIQTAIHQGYSGIADLHEQSEALDDVKSYIFNTAAATEQLGIVIPETFSSYLLTVSQKPKLVDRLLNIPNSYFVSARVCGPKRGDSNHCHDDKFQTTVAFQGSRRAWQTTTPPTQAINLNIRDSAIPESKAYNKRGFVPGQFGSNRFEKYCKNEEHHRLRIVNDRVLIKRSGNDYVNAQPGDEGAFLCSERTLRDWQTSDKTHSLTEYQEQFPLPALINFYFKGDDSRPSSELETLDDNASGTNTSGYISQGDEISLLQRELDEMADQIEEEFTTSTHTSLTPINSPQTSLQNTLQSSITTQSLRDSMHRSFYEELITAAKEQVRASLFIPEMTSFDDEESEGEELTDEDSDSDFDSDETSSKYSDTPTSTTPASSGHAAFKVTPSSARKRKLNIDAEAQPSDDTSLTTSSPKKKPRLDEVNRESIEELDVSRTSTSSLAQSIMAYRLTTDNKTSSSSSLDTDASMQQIDLSASTQSSHNQIQQHLTNNPRSFEATRNHLATHSLPNYQLSPSLLSKKQEASLRLCTTVLTEPLDESGHHLPSLEQTATPSETQQHPQESLVTPTDRPEYPQQPVVNSLSSRTTQASYSQPANTRVIRPRQTRRYSAPSLRIPNDTEQCPVSTSISSNQTQPSVERSASLTHSTTAANEPLITTTRQSTNNPSFLKRTLSAIWQPASNWEYLLTPFKIVETPLRLAAKGFDSLAKQAFNKGGQPGWRSTPWKIAGGISKAVSTLLEVPNQLVRTIASPYSAYKERKAKSKWLGYASAAASALLIPAAFLTIGFFAAPALVASFPTLGSIVPFSPLAHGLGGAFSLGSFTVSGASAATCAISATVPSTIRAVGNSCMTSHQADQQSNNTPDTTVTDANLPADETLNQPGSTHQRVRAWLNHADNPANHRQKHLARQTNSTPRPCLSSSLSLSRQRTIIDHDELDPELALPQARIS